MMREHETGESAGLPALGDRVRVRDLAPGTWASTRAGREGVVERVEGIDFLVRMDGEPEGGEQAWLQVHEVDVVARNHEGA